MSGEIITIDGTWQEEREANIDEQIYAKANPSKGAGVPW